MSLYTYAIIEAVVREKSFLRAAKSLNLSSSAVSHSISRFEKQLGFPLFVRNRNSVELTSNGEHIFTYISQVLKCNDRLEQEAKNMINKESGCVKIGTFNSVCVSWLPNIVKSFKKKYPNIDIIIYQGGYEDILHWLKTHMVDIAFVSQAISGNMDITVIHQDRLVCITPTDFKPINKLYVTIDDIKGKQLIHQGAGNNAETERFLSKYQIQSESKCFVEDDLSVIAMVECGFGISILQELVVQDIHADISIYPIVPAEYRTIGITVGENPDMAPATRLMYNHIVDNMAEVYSK